MVEALTVISQQSSVISVLGNRQSAIGSRGGGGILPQKDGQKKVENLKGAYPGELTELEKL